MKTDGASAFFAGPVVRVRGLTVHFERETYGPGAVARLRVEGGRASSLEIVDAATGVSVRSARAVGGPVVGVRVGAWQPGVYAARRAGVALVAVPIIEGGHLRGILAADSATRRSPRPIAICSPDGSAQVLRVVQSERVFRAVERAKYEHERFYQATAMLTKALTVEQVIETAFDAAAAITDYDAAVIALYEKDGIASPRSACVRAARAS